ncbi:DUF1566 domain-containing protein [Comamonadaceae bacterium OH3737_COT-264]|nr:DUF1566 domain-containing protein [Comamonadaceae bacterium OH3737_COT-264]
MGTDLRRAAMQRPGNFSQARGSRPCRRGKSRLAPSTATPSTLLFNPRPPGPIPSQSETAMPIPSHPLPRPAAQPRPRWRTAPVALALALGAAAMPALAACPSSAPGRFVPTGANNAEVQDTETGLIWARCSVGQSWDGSACTGTVSEMTHEAALAHAKGQAGWRLPNVKELSSLLDRGCSAPAIDATVFPNTPGNWYWTATPSAGDPANAWDVYFGNGYVNNYHRHYDVGAVRLVRASQ